MKKHLALLLLLCLLWINGCAAAQGSMPQAEMTLFAINVGKADCLLLQSGESIYMIDTGTKESWGRVSCALRMLGVARLDGVILTHTDGDHAGGAWALASSGIAVDAWYAPVYYEGVKKDKHPAMLAAALRNQEVRWLKSGDTLPFDGGSLTVLGPMSASDKENCNSVVLLAEAAGGRMLLCGDMEFPEENELLNAGLIPSCDVMKVGNHAESDATSSALVSAVKPRVAVISTNSVEEPDTPAPRVLKLLRNIGAKIMLTQGAEAGVRVSVRGGEVTAESCGYGRLPEKVAGVLLTEKSVSQQLVRVSNTGTQAVDLSGWYIFSDRGGETFVFPEGCVLDAGKTLTITSLSSDVQGDLVWQESKVWHKSKEDHAMLYDAYGRLMDTE